MSSELTMSLCAACKKGSVEEVREAIAAGADPNIEGPRDIIPLHIACEGQSVEIVRCLLDHGADVNCQDKYWHWTPLYIACSRDKPCLPIVQCLVKHGASLNEIDNRDCKPLHAACKLNNPNLVRFLIDQGADIDDNNTRDGETPLLVVCNEERWDVVLTLIERGADFHVISLCGYTPFHYACEGNFEQLVSYFIDHGIDVNSKLPCGSAPLALAARGGSPNVLQCLLNGGANVNAVDRGERSPLHLACKRDAPEHALILIQNGGDFHAADKQGSTPLHEACKGFIKRDGARVVECLLEIGADVDAMDHMGKSPLHEACLCQSREMVKVLLRYRACVNVADDDGNTPLHCALLGTMPKNIGVVSCLLESGADPRALSNKGLTPFQSISSNTGAPLFGIWAGMSLDAEQDVTYAQGFLTDAACYNSRGAREKLLFARIVFANIPLLPLDHRDALSAHIKTSSPDFVRTWYTDVLDELIRIRENLCEWLDTQSFPTLKTQCRAAIRRHLGPVLISRIRPFCQSYPRVLVEYIYLYHDARAVFSDDVSVIDELFRR